MNTTNTKWRLLDPKTDTLQAGDQCMRLNPIRSFSEPEWWDIDEEFHGQGVPTYNQFRRPMTPAEIHAEELLASIQNYFEAFGCDSDEGHALMRMEKAVCAATGTELSAGSQIIDAVLNPEP